MGDHPNTPNGEGTDQGTAGDPNPTQTEQTDKCLASIKDKLHKLSPHVQNYGAACIYEVPKKHRNKNPEAYTPRLVSVGFVHHRESQLQTMEEHKLKYLNNFLRTFQVSLEKLVKYAQEVEKEVCGCYRISYSQIVKKLKPATTPCEVILLDGIFVTQVFLKNYFVEMRENEDIIFDNPWVSNEILHDLMLFENQLPFKFLHTLYEKFVFNELVKWLDGDTVHPPSFNELVHKFFKDVGNTGKLLLTRDFSKARHLVEFLSILHCPSERNKMVIIPISGTAKRKVEKKSDFCRCPTATELKAAGVKFKRSEENYFFDIDFDSSKGVLTIPPLTVNDSTETFFRNLIAFEQSGCHSKNTRSFVVFMDNLIDTRKDVELLMEHENEIIRNELSSSQEVADMFNNIYKEFVADPVEFYFVKECELLNDYSRGWWHKWLAKLTKWYAMLRRDYFSSPWSVISLIAAIIILGLTATQTAFSVH